MKNIVFALFIGFVLFGCSSTKKTETVSTNIKQELDEKNRGNIPLLTRLRQLPGVVLKRGVPVVAKASNSLSPNETGEPLYVLNGQIIGSSFRRIDEIVDNYNVKEIKLLTGASASYYGVQGAKGVIEISTYQ